jgi:hypothetical protein
MKIGDIVRFKQDTILNFHNLKVSAGQEARIVELPIQYPGTIRVVIDGPDHMGKYGPKRYAVQQKDVEVHREAK